jgi:peptide/nickel transport system substrate-binding protein
MRALFAGALAAVAVSGSAASAGPQTARSAATPAAAPFAEAWAAIPTTATARRAANIVVFAGFPVSGFNSILTCCNNNWNYWMGHREALHGAYIQDDRGEWVKDLVTRVSVSTTRLTYTISPKAFWYWGGKKLPVTYKDFVYTLQQIDNPRNDVVSRAGYANLDPTRFTHDGDKQVTLFWKTTDCSTDFPCGPYANWQYLFGNLYPAEALVGLDFNTIWTNCICGTDGKPVSNGPFYLANYTAGQGSVLKANPYWGGAKPKIAAIVLKEITDPNLVVEAMRSGAVDAITPFFGQHLPLKGTPGIKIDQAPQYFMELLFFREGNAKGAPSVVKGSANVLLRAPWMREAIGLAIDRQSIIDTLFGSRSGLKPLESLLFFATQANYRPDFARWNYKPAKALALMKAHCTGGPSRRDPRNTKIWRCSGLPASFSWTWTWRAEDGPRTQLEALAKADLKSVGIAITERPLPTNAIFGPTGIPSGDFDIASFGYFALGDPADWYPNYRCFGESNYTGYCSHTVDALLEAANRELRPARRASLFRQADAILATQVPAMPLFQRPAVLIHKSDLLGMRLSPGGDGPFWNVEDWHWKR